MYGYNQNPSGYTDPNSLSSWWSSLGAKRTSQAMYQQNVVGTHNTMGQADAWYSANAYAKRPRVESASNLPIYPQRPGEKDCAHYMLTRTCKFGDTCRFDHPVWVPEGGIPDWKEQVPLAAPEVLPERPGAPDCPYFLKTQRCKFGVRCKFNHPKDQLVSAAAAEDGNSSGLPERPSEPPCSFYMKTGVCKFGVTCRFNHPKEIQPLLAGHGNGGGAQIDSAIAPVPEAFLHNSKGLPIRPGEADCPFYLKTGSCKYGPTCRYNHPDRAVYTPTLMVSPAGNLSVSVNPAASVYQNLDPSLLVQTSLALGQTAPGIYPQRPGQAECDFYMKTGVCKYAETCRFHHPIDRTAALERNVKLTLAGLPRREGATACPYYMKTGTCQYGVMCKFDHPPPAEAMAMAATTTAGEDLKQDLQ